MSEYRDAVKVAHDSVHLKPPWVDVKCSPQNGLGSITQRAIDMYLKSKKPGGLMGGIGWWQSANGYTAMALRDLWSGSKQNYDELDNILRACERNHPRPGFVNEFNDDSVWWALCCVHMYSIGGDVWYLKQAEDIWRHVRKSVCSRGQEFFNGDDMEGAVFWTTRPGEDHINAISTGLYAELSARLALLSHRSEPEAEPSSADYIEAARSSLGWVLRCRYRREEGVVLDHIELNRPKAVDWTFTYNTGVALGTCALLYEATGEEEYMTLACHMAHKSMTRPAWVEENGVLTERHAYGRGKSDPLKNNDSVGFKAVLIRQLGTLYDVITKTNCTLLKAREEATLIKTFVNINFQSQQERNTNGRAQYGPWWNGPFEVPTSHSQMAALDVMAAAMLVNSV